MHTIEYIGPRPKKPVKRSWISAWFMVVMVVVGVTLVVKPYVSQALAENEKVTELKVEETTGWLKESPSFGYKLAVAALERTKSEVVYDPAYYQIPYPNGDIPEEKGVCTDVVVRSFRALNVDLQQLVHQDMKPNFRIYPQLWNLKKPDTNIDHRRVPNLQRFFRRKGAEVKSNTGHEAEGFEYGDVVAWRLPDGKTHIGIVVPGPGTRRAERWIVHNIGRGPKWENGLLDYQVIGQYRYIEE